MPVVYLIARFEQGPSPGSADPLEKNIVYIGQSSAGRFQGRCRAFENAAFRNKGKNRAGKRYRQLFDGNSSPLYVSVLSGKGLVKAFLGLEVCPLLDINGSSAKVDITDKLLGEIDDLLIKYMERRLILLYSLAHGYRPVCNVD